MVYGLVRQWWQGVRDRNYTALASAVVVFFLLVFGLWQGYQWYVVSREEKAQFAMSEAFEEYDKALYQMIDEKKTSREVAQQRMEDAHLSFDVILRNHDGSFLAPYAHAFEADIYWYEGKKDEALLAMEKAVKGSAKSPLIYLLKTKNALMKLDANREQEGVSELSTLARDSKNSNADTAAFYLGYYYWSKKDEVHARESWQLLEKFADTKGVQRATSPWLAIAQMKLGFIS